MTAPPHWNLDLKRETVFSPDRVHRYTLWREFPPQLYDRNPGFVNFIGLNPSTADEENDDPTIRRCMAFAIAWGYSAFCMTNLFAFRATFPDDMFDAANPVGIDNDDWLKRIAADAAVIVAAWGVHGEHQRRGNRVRYMLREEKRTLHYLRLTLAGHPQHPLYLKKNLTPQLWS